MKAKIFIPFSEAKIYTYSIPFYSGQYFCQL